MIGSPAKTSLQSANALSVAGPDDGLDGLLPLVTNIDVSKLAVSFV